MKLDLFWETKMPRYMWSLPVGQLKVGETYPSLPLQCTIMPYFELPESAKGYVRETADLVRGGGAVTLEGSKRDLFGRDRNVPVTRVKPTEQILRLHRSLLRSISYLPEVSVCDPDWAGDGYKPHVSDQAEESFAVGQTALVEKIVLLQSFRDGKYAAASIEL